MKSKYDERNAELDAKMMPTVAAEELSMPEPLPEGTPEEESVEPPTEEAVESTVPESEYQALQARYEASVKAMNKAQSELAAERRAKEIPSEPELEPESTPTEPEGDSEAMAMLREDFPELATAMDELKSNFDKKLDEIKMSHSEMMGKHDQLSGNFGRRYWNEINRAVPDLKDFQETPEFNAWYAEQSPDLQEQLVSADHADVISALKKYKADTGETLPPATEEPTAPEMPVEPDVTVVKLDIGKQKENKMAKAEAEAAPVIASSSRLKSDKPFKRLSRVEHAQLSTEEMAAYDKALDEHMIKAYAPK